LGKRDAVVVLGGKVPTTGAFGVVNIFYVFKVVFDGVADGGRGNFY